MDARKEVAAWFACTFGIHPTAADSAVARIENIYAENGYQIIHRDENHGPTLERAAEVAASNYDGHGAEFGTARSRNYEHAGKTIASVIRTMEVK